MPLHEPVQAPESAAGNRVLAAELGYSTSGSKMTQVVSEVAEAAEAAEAEAYMQTSTMSKPDRGHQDVACPKCGIESVVRIGNTLRCNSCSHQWPAVKTVEFDPKIMGRTATMAK